MEKPDSSLVLGMIILALLLITCTSIKKDFDYGLRRVIELNVEYGASIGSPPSSFENVTKLLKGIDELSYLRLESGQEPFDTLIKYEINDLSATKLHIQAAEYGISGTTKYGFGCKSKPAIMQSTLLRNQSANAGFKAVEMMDSLIKSYPNEAAKSNITQKSKLFLNATYYVILKDANTDRKLIENFCPDNQTISR